MAFVKRKKIRLEGYDYSSCGAYFITICVADRNRLLWQNAEADYDRKRAEAYSHEPPLLSGAGTIVKNEIQKLSTIYGNVMVDQYCIMPDHIHLILLILPDEKGQAHPAPTVSRIIKQFKGSVTKQIGNSIWQKSFYDKIIRNERDYQEVWQYILELNRSFDASASFVLLRYRRVPTSFYQNLSKKSQGSLFVSLFNFQGPLPLKERAFCILPHHRRFVNTFFSACPGFLPPHRFFLLTFLFKAALFLRSLHSLSVPLSKSA